MTLISSTLGTVSSLPRHALPQSTCHSSSNAIIVDYHSALADYLTIPPQPAGVNVDGHAFNSTLRRIEIITGRLRKQHQELYQSLPDALQYSEPTIDLYSNDSGVITTTTYNLLDAVTMFASRLQLATQLTPTEFHRDHPTVWFILENGPFSIFRALENATSAAQQRSQATRAEGVLIETIVRSTTAVRAAPERDRT